MMLIKTRHGKALGRFMSWDGVRQALTNEWISLRQSIDQPEALPSIFWQSRATCWTSDEAQIASGLAKVRGLRPQQQRRCYGSPTARVQNYFRLPCVTCRAASLWSIFFSMPYYPDTQQNCGAVCQSALFGRSY